jgi:excisionase family DNA binding protein
MDKEYLTVKQLAEKLQVEVSTIYTWRTKRKLPCFSKSPLRFDMDQVEEWMKQSNKEEK